MNESESCAIWHACGLSRLKHVMNILNQASSKTCSHFVLDVCFIYIYTHYINIYIIVLYTNYSDNYRLNWYKYQYAFNLQDILSIIIAIVITNLDLVLKYVMHTDIMSILNQGKMILDLPRRVQNLHKAYMRVYSRKLYLFSI